MEMNNSMTALKDLQSHNGDSNVKESNSMSVLDIQNSGDDENLVKSKQDCYLEKLKDELGSADQVFYEMLKEEIEFAYYKKEEHKDAAFSIQNNMIELAAEGVSKISSAVLSLTAATTIYGFFVESAVNWKWKIIVGVVAVILLLVATYTLGKNKLNQNKESRETWVRHSLHYNRLMLLVKNFVGMNDYSPKAIEKFKKAVFEQMEANLEKFEKNMKE